MNDRSNAALRERLELAKKATPKGERTLWTVDPAVRGDLCIRDAFNERMLTMEDSTDKATAHHIAANHPDVVRTDLEEIFALRAEVERLRKQLDGLKKMAAFSMGCTSHPQWEKKYKLQYGMEIFEKNGIDNVIKKFRKYYRELPF